jgi:hypothetical protein
MVNFDTILKRLALITVPVVGAFVCWNLYAAHGVVTGAQQIVAEVVRPCKGQHGPDACGVFAQVKKSVIDMDDITITAQKQVGQSAALISQYGKTLDQAAGDVHTVAVSVAGTADAATQTALTAREQLTHVAPMLDAATGALDAIPDTLRHVDSAADNANGAVTDFRKFLNAPALSATVTNTAAMTGSWAAISFDAERVADKETKDFLKPVPWYLWPVKRSGEILDIGAAVARHTP